MRSGQCDHCGAETSHGLALCTGCQSMFLMLVEQIPIHFRNLSRWRPSIATSDRKRTKSEDLVKVMARIHETGEIDGLGRPAGFRAAVTDDRIPRLLDEAHADLTGWALSLADDRPELARVIDRILAMDAEPCVRLLCALLTKRVMTLTTLPWVRDLVHGVMAMHHRLEAETMRSVPGWYAGACKRCGTDTRVVPGLTYTTCQTCGMTTAARDHLEVILDEARGWVARPKALAEALVALVDTEQSVPRLYERIKRWGQPDRQKITPVVVMRRAHVFDLEAETIVVGEEPAGHARYRFGEVYDVLMTAGATRATTSRTTSAPRAC